MIDIQLTKEEVAAEKYKEFDPDRHDFIWQSDGTCRIVSLLWWDDASYIRYQSDCGED